MNIDLHENKQPFNAALILLAHDFQQTLSIISHLILADELNACLIASHSWRHVKLQSNSAEYLQYNFCILEMRKLQLKKQQSALNDQMTFTVLLIHSHEELVQCVLSDIKQNYKSYQWLSEHSILAIKNVDVIFFSYQHLTYVTRRNNYLQINRYCYRWIDRESIFSSWTFIYCMLLYGKTMGFFCIYAKWNHKNIVYPRSLQWT